VGAGAGMSCFGFKGGIGTASRALRIGEVEHSLGALVLANFGRAGDLRLPDGRRIAPDASVTPENGSVIVVIATDIPLDHRQLRRVIRRAGAGLAWAGSFWGHQSGDVFLGFTTSNRVPHDARDEFLSLRMLNENCLDPLFQAAAEATQEAVYDALAAADTMRGRAGHTRPGLRHALGRSR
jgi:D-aminopeptidase